MKIAVTGHRPHKLGSEYDGQGPYSTHIRSRLQAVITAYKDESLTLISGMALGVDMIWAELAIANNIPFIAAIPCSNQQGMWPLASQHRYQSIIDHPLCTIHMVSLRPYHPSCMQDRNIWMVDHCDLLVAVWDGSLGGTKNCYDYARRSNKQILKISVNHNTIPKP